MLFMFLLNYRNNLGSLGELEKAVETAYPVLLNFHSCIYHVA